MSNLYVWDFHGTLEKGNEYAMREICESILEQFGHPRKVTIDEVLYLYGNTWGAYFKALASSVSDEEVARMVDAAIAMSQKITKNYLKPMDHATDVFLLLKVKGHTNIVISNCRQDRLDDFMEIVGLAPFAAGAIGVSRQGEQMFGDPVKFKAEAILKFANGKKFGKVFMVGDKESDIDAGLLAGATTVLFDPRKTGVDTKAHHTVADLREVLTL